MLLQKVLMPDVNTCTEETIFYRADSQRVRMTKDKTLVFKEESIVTFDTYFNGFSTSKWKSYTVLDNLWLNITIKGSFCVELKYAYKTFGEIIHSTVATDTFCCEDNQSFSLNYPEIKDKGIYYFSLTALTDKCELLDAEYFTNISSDEVNRVKIAIDICTFKREAFVENNIKILNDQLINNSLSLLCDNLHVFISDNGQSLNVDKLSSDSIHLYPNKNLGGAGGFGRSMIEILNVQDSLSFTHIIMMDDDITIEPQSLERLFAFLKLLKPQYKQAFIGGAMLRLDKRYIQSEVADFWELSKHHPVKYNYDLRFLNMVLKNEIEDSINHFGWWFSCMPIETISYQNLPLPIFIKRDDVEYGLRNCNKFITLNGICVWHEPFENKRTPYLEYYYVRNTCIINSIHRRSFDRKKAKKYLWRMVRECIMRYRYDDAELQMYGMADFLKGIDWLKVQDGESLNAQIMKMAPAKYPIEDINCDFTHGLYERNLEYKERRLKKLFRYVTLNGWLLPSKGTIIVPAVNPSSASLFRKKRVINYEEASNTGFVTYKSYKKAINTWRRYRKVCKMINKSYELVRNEYLSRFDELTSIEFWQQYLFSDQQRQPASTEERAKSDNIRSRFTKVRQIKSFVKYICYLGFRSLQRVLLWWLPIKKNRVMLYVHNRKGFVCNPKYIAQDLKAKHSDELELIWVSMYPESCQQVRDYGIQVVKYNSFEHFCCQITSKVLITNDALPPKFMKRYRQTVINTWHAGMNYKKIGFDSLLPQPKFERHIFNLKNKQPDIYLSGSRFFTEDTSKSFGFNPNIFMPTGLPRNDLLINGYCQTNEMIREKYVIKPDTKIALYAPTFRSNYMAESHGLDFFSLKRHLEESFGGKWVIFYRGHYFVKKIAKVTGAIDVSFYHDMQELMCAADLLISDYSSCMWDFSFTRRPCFVYAPDVNEYINNDRDLALPLSEWPYPIASSNSELKDNLSKFDLTDYQKRVDDHHMRMGSYETSNSSAIIGDLIYSIIRKGKRKAIKAYWKDQKRESVK